VQLAHHGYVTLIQPWFKAKEKDIDAFLDNLKGLVLAKINQGLQFLIANSPAIIAGVLYEPLPTPLCVFIEISA
jgi:hypothetical protein